MVFLSPNKPILFASHFVVAFFFYLATKNIRISLFYTFILSLFSDVSLGKSIFLLEYGDKNFGSGYGITPLTLMVLSLLFLSWKRRMKLIRAPDILLLLFFLWNVIILIIWPYENVLFGIINLGEILLVYYLIRIYVRKENLIDISYLLISMLLFQSILGGLQILSQGNLGILAESSSLAYPFGITAVEERTILRITGTFGHANMFGVVIITLLPFLFFLGRQMFVFVSLLSLISLIFTFSRSAWLIGFPLFGYLILKSNFFKRRKISPEKYKLGIFVTAFFTIMLFIFLMPYFFIRLETIPRASEEFGSFGVRAKLIQEGIGLIEQYPLTGVGINRSQQFALENPMTDIFNYPSYTASNRIHNVFIEMAAEIGIPGLFIFCLFLFTVIYHYWRYAKRYKNQKDNNIYLVKRAAFYGLISIILISQFHPFFLISQFRIFFLLSAIILV